MPIWTERWRRLLPARPATLAARGVLGMNERNLRYLAKANPYDQVNVVDDKVRTKALCLQHGIPVPETLAVIERYGDIGRIAALHGGSPEFVVKPGRGAGGRGILVVVGSEADGSYRLSNGQLLPETRLHQHLGGILAGLHSLGGRPDHVLVEQRIVCHPAFVEVAAGGTPDIRVLIYRQVPVMAMTRLPTVSSHGHANLHQGAIGAGIDLHTGRTTHGVRWDRAVYRHPDTGHPIGGFPLPHWPEILHAASRLAAIVGLGYVGVDVMIDAARGALIVEANARPGLAIQIANRCGLVPRLELVDAMHDGESVVPCQAELLERLSMLA